MLTTPPDAVGYLLVARDVGLHSSSPPVETPLTRAPWLYLARETETPFTPTVSFSIDARDTPPKEMSIQRQPSAAGVRNAPVAFTCLPTAHAVGCTALLGSAVDVPPRCSCCFTTQGD
jgi:hypothetical protein